MKRNIIIIFMLLALTHVCRAQVWDTYIGVDFGTPNGEKTLFKYGDTLIVSPVVGVDGIVAEGIAGLWDNTWHTYGSGFFVDGIDCAAWHENRLYVGGSIDLFFPIPNDRNFVWWENNTWHPTGIPMGVTDVVKDMTIHDDTLFFIIGSIILIWNSNPPQIIRYDTNFVTGINGTHCLTEYNGDLYCGHDEGISKYLGGGYWTGYDWNLGDAHPWLTYALLEDTINNFLYAGGGAFNLSNGLESWSVARFNGFFWEAMANNIYGTVYTLQMYHGDLYAGGYLDTLSAYNITNQWLVRWNGTEWEPVGTAGNPNSTVMDMEIYHDTLWVAGFFDTIAGQPSIGLAKWYNPDTSCNFLQPRAFALADTFYLSGGQTQVQFFNNNAYASSWTWDFGDGGSSPDKDPAHIFTQDSVFNACVTVSQGACTKTACKTVTVLNPGKDFVLSPGQLNIRVYPNPTTGDFYVECDLPGNKTGRVDIRTSAGMLRHTSPLEPGHNKRQIPASEFSAGVLLVVVYVDGVQVWTEKVVKNQ